MSELLPCPFCGGEAVFNTYRTTCSVDCPECRIGTYQVALDDYKAAIDAWNTRADRTCENISEPPTGFYCSACHWGDFCEPSHLLTTAKFTGRVDGGPNYCPNCGAKVME